MRVAVFNTKEYDRQYLESANANHGRELVFFEPRLNFDTAVLASGFPAICVFINDLLDLPTLNLLAKGGTRAIALRSAGFNHVDLAAAKSLGMTVVRVPAYSPYAVAEHTVGLILALNRKIHRAYNRVRESNFSLEGLLGFDLHGCTVGVVGTGKIGALVARIMHGFDCHLLAYDLYQNPDCLAMGVKYVDLPELLANSDIVTLHCPLTPKSHYLINTRSLEQIKPGVMLNEVRLETAIAPKSVA